MSSQIDLSFMVVFPSLPGTYKQAISFSIADSCITHYFELFWKIPLILYFENISNTSPRKYVARYLVLLMSLLLTVFININNTKPSSLVRKLNDILGINLFLWKVELTRLPNTCLKSPQVSQNVFTLIQLI